MRSFILLMAARLPLAACQSTDTSSELSREGAIAIWDMDSLHSDPAMF